MSQHRPLEILISGSGIAAASFAFWLLRAYPDTHITILERAPSLRLTGASVDIRAWAVDIIKWMGLEEEIRRHGTNEEGLSFVGREGKEIATFKATGRTDVQSFTSEFEIFRGELAKVLMAPVLESVEVVYGESVREWSSVEADEDEGERVVVTMETSGETRKFDLLVAADGLGSKIRGKILNAPPRAQVRDEDMYAAYFTVPTDLLEGSHIAKWYNATGGRAIFIRPDPHPDRRARVNFINIVSKSDAELKARFEAAQSEGGEEYMKLMEETFADAGWLAPEALKGMRQSHDFYSSLFAQVRSPRLQDGRVVLVGDAGYATPGFGTSLAIIGGYVLAGELLRSGGDVVAATKRYEEVMLPYVKESQWDLPQLPQMLNPQTKYGLAIRDGILRFVTTMRIDKLAMFFATWLGSSEKKKKPFPEYEWPSKEREG